MKDVFISYKAEELDEATWVKSVLETNGISCWMAPASIPGGSSYASAIPRAIREAKAMVLILSDRAQRSPWISKEVDIAIGEGKIVLPFMLENCALKDDFNFYLTNVQRYTAYENKAAAMEKMVRELKALLGANVPAAPAVPVQPAAQPFRPAAPQPQPQPVRPVQPVSRPVVPTAPAPQPVRPMNPNPQPVRPVQPPVQPIRPVQPAPQPQMQYVPIEKKPEYVGPKPRLDVCCVLSLVWGIIALASLGVVIVPEIVAIVTGLIGVYKAKVGGLRGVKIAIVGFVMGLVTLIFCLGVFDLDGVEYLLAVISGAISAAAFGIVWNKAKKKAGM